MNDETLFFNPSFVLLAYVNSGFTAYAYTTTVAFYMSIHKCPKAHSTRM